MRQRPVLGLLLFALPLSTACLEQAGDRIGDALPRAADVQIKLPGETAASAAPEGLGETQQALIGEVAAYYRVTRTVSRDLNRGVGGVLLLVHTIVQYPPTSIDGNAFVWGPHSDALDPSEWRLTVTEHDAGARYTWELDGRDKTTADSVFVTMLAGEAEPGAEPHRGSGSFSLDFDAAAIANPVEHTGETGLVTVHYDLENRDATPAVVDMVIDGVDEATGAPVHFEYTYRENLDTSGDFRFAIVGDLDDEGALAEQAEIRSRWLVTGAGRADVSVSGGDLGALEVTAVECWDAAFRRTYYADSQDWQPAEGDAAGCAL